MCPAWVASESRVNAGLLTRFHIEKNFRHWVKMETRRVRKEVSLVYCQDREVGDPMIWWTNSNCSCPKRWLKTSCGLELATRFTELIVDKEDVSKCWFWYREACSWAWLRIFDIDYCRYAAICLCHWIVGCDFVSIFFSSPVSEICFWSLGSACCITN